MGSHWLMKTEPESFGIDDLERVKVEPWTGVRNYMARKLMRDQMQVGDAVLFYHSSCEPPGVAGLARVARTGVVDATQFDPASKYYDPGSKADAPRWICVDVEFLRKLPRLIALAELRAHPGLDGLLLLQRGARLSVQPVSAEHYRIIVGLIEQPAPPLAAKPVTAKAKPAAKARSAAKAKPTAQAKPASKATSASKARATPPSTKPAAKAKAKATKTTVKAGRKPTVTRR